MIRHRIIGNRVLLWALALSCSNLYAAHITLNVLSLENEPLTSVHADSVFKLVVKITGTHEPIDKRSVVIDNLTKLTVLEVNNGPQRIALDNGQASFSTLIYTVKAKQVETLTVGPAHGVVDGTEYTSASVAVLVEPALPIDQHAVPARGGVALTVKANKRSYVQYEQAEIRILFNTDDQSIVLADLTIPSIPLFKNVQIQGPKKFTQEINGRRIFTIQYTARVVLEHPGELVVPAVTASYHTFDNSMHQLIARAFNRVQNSQTASEPLHIDVQPLDLSDKQVSGIGHFSNARLRTSCGSLVQGTGCTVTLEVDSTALSAVRKAPVLELPAGLQGYEPKVTMQAQSDRVVHRFDYVVQGLQPDTYKLEPQEFSYFDTQTKSYKVLRTASTDLTVTPSSQQQRYTPAPSAGEKSGKGPVLDTSENALVKLLDQYPSKAEGASIPWPVYLTLVSLSLLLVPIGYIRGLLARRAGPFTVGYKQVDSAQKANNPTALYGILQTTLANVEQEYHLAPGALVELLPAGKQVSWQVFNKQLLTGTYGGYKYEQDIYNSLYQQSRVWLRSFQDCLKRVR